MPTSPPAAPNSISSSIQEAVRCAERLGARDFELYFSKRTATKIDSKDGKVDSLSRAEDVGMSVRIIHDQRPGFSFTTSLTPQSIENAIRNAIEIARVMPSDPFAHLPLFANRNFPQMDLWDPTGLQAPVAQKVELAQELEALCRASDPRITGIRSASISETTSESWLVDAQSKTLHQRSTIYAARIACKAESGGDSQMGGDFDFSHRLENLDYRSVATRAAKRAVELLQSKQAPTLICPAVLRNNVVADLVSFVSSSFSAEEIDKGRSMLAGKLGQELFSPAITIEDDGLLPGGIATSPFDGEGTASRKTPLVEKGRIAAFLYDTYYARKFGTKPTGNAMRGIKSPPSIGTNNLSLRAGSISQEKLIRDIERGILITDLMGLHTANSVTGDFSLGASGVLIENGILTQPVRGFAVAGNVLELFRRMTDVGSDLRFFGSIGAPSVRVAEISVGGK